MSEHEFSTAGAGAPVGEVEQSGQARSGPVARRWAVLAVAGLLLTGRLVRAEDGVAYKYADYREAGGRIAVQTQSALVEQSLGTDMSFKLAGTIDAIAGATPTGQPAPAGSSQVPLTHLADRRKAWDATFARQFAPVKVSLGLANSRESDYVSTGWSINTQTDFNQKNTTLLAGLAGTDDDVKVFYQTPWAKKRGQELMAGLTQLIDPQTTVTANLLYGHTTGDLSDQYKLVVKSTPVAPGVILPLFFAENRPGTRDKWVLFTSLAHAFKEVAGTLDASYRLYHDTFGATANTLELKWLQRIGDRIIVIPELRGYTQTAANFYYYNLDTTGVVPVSGQPPAQGPFYSSDYRLSALQSYTYGLKAVWTPVARLQLDAAIERYEMRGTDGVTAQSAYPRATIVTGGVKWSW